MAHQSSQASAVSLNMVISQLSIDDIQELDLQRIHRTTTFNDSEVNTGTTTPTFVSPSEESLTVQDTISTLDNLPARDIKHEPKVQLQVEVKAVEDTICSRSEEDALPADYHKKIPIRSAFLGNWKKLIPHILSIFATSMVVQLSFRNAYWMDLKSPTAQLSPGLTQSGALNFLQLAAKLHELLVLASISSVVLHAVQSHLTGKFGLPLGMIANSFELTSGNFLCRKSFWKVPWSVDPKTGKRFLYTRFWLLSLVAAALVLLSGPSSAIAVIPSLNYFALQKPLDTSLFPYYVFNQSGPLWPAVLKSENLVSPTADNLCQNPYSRIEQQYCPAAGYRDNLAWTGSLIVQNTDHGSNISYGDDLGSRRRIVMARSCNTTLSDGRASAIGIPVYLNNAFSAYWAFLQNTATGILLDSTRPRVTLDTKAYAPRVEVLCNGYPNVGNPPRDPEHSAPMFYPTWSNASQYPVPDKLYRYARSIDASNFTLNEIDSNEFEAPSLGAVITVPVVYSDQDEADPANITYYQTTQNYACSIYAQWVPIEAWYEPKQDDFVQISVDSALGSTCLSTPSTFSAKSKRDSRPPINITIDQDYANGLNAPVLFTNIGIMRALVGMIEKRIHIVDQLPNGRNFNPPYNGLIPLTTEDVIQAGAKAISTMLAGMVTDGIGRIAGNGGWPYSAPMFLLPNTSASGSLQGLLPITSFTMGEIDDLNTTSIADASNWLPINFSFSRYGYGYSWRGSRTAQFGTSVLLVHVLVAVIHTVMLLIEIFGARRKILRAWEDIPEMFVAAMNSKPSERLRGIFREGGIKGGWNEVVAVRENQNGKDGELEVIVGKEDIEFSAPKRRATGFSSIFSGSGGGKRSEQ